MLIKRYAVSYRYHSRFLLKWYWRRSSLAGARDLRGLPRGSYRHKSSVEWRHVKLLPPFSRMPQDAEATEQHRGLDAISGLGR